MDIWSCLTKMKTFFLVLGSFLKYVNFLLHQTLNWYLGTKKTRCPCYFIPNLEFEFQMENALLVILVTMDNCYLVDILLGKRWCNLCKTSIFYLYKMTKSKIQLTLIVFKVVLNFRFYNIWYEKSQVIERNISEIQKKNLTESPL